ncbi:tRNA lysidine(34) synthetase TilS [Pasteurella canis]|uniref:tRNA lysidine(34) synthetase TilS n=1 Tax=Pasteurella canis TaxID=753 RepID=UPI001D11FB52|nr:tRNA lysidine(34) synthetase TilS [Pasteurella canis]UDW82812.1 tRNA lysidine(34) synthetase TilS [Pasteurella canis]
MLLNRFQTQIDNYAATQIHFLIGFSGGLDSTALLRLFTKLREKRPHLQLRAIHIHHGLSPHAENWAKHCRKICSQLEVPLLIEKVQVNPQRGIEAGAREARYKAIAQHILPNEILATAHHLQDQTETFFLALKRGSGLQGLSAMQMQGNVYNVPVLRPLLAFSRPELEQFVQSEELDWVEDESNNDNRYERNFLRNEILPTLRQRWTYFDFAVQRSALHCFEQQQLINELLADEFAQNFDKTDRSFNIQPFVQDSVSKQKALLRLWLNEWQLPMPSLAQLEQIIQDVIFAKTDSNPLFQLGEKVVRRHQQKLYLTPQFTDISTHKIDVKVGEKICLPDNLGTLTLTQQADKFLLQWKNEQLVTQELPFTNAPIQVRFSYAGKVRLTEKSANKEMKKVWQHFNVPVWQRQRIPLIFYGDKLKSAVGFFEVLDDKNKNENKN